MPLSTHARQPNARQQTPTDRETTDRQTDRQRDRQTDQETERQRGQRDRQADRETDRQTERQTERERERERERDTDRQRDREDRAYAHPNTRHPRCPSRRETRCSISSTPSLITKRVRRANTIHQPSTHFLSSFLRLSLSLSLSPLSLLLLSHSFFLSVYVLPSSATWISYSLINRGSQKRNESHNKKSAQNKQKQHTLKKASGISRKLSLLSGSEMRR